MRAAAEQEELAGSLADVRFACTSASVTPAPKLPEADEKAARGACAAGLRLELRGAVTPLLVAFFPTAGFGLLRDCEPPCLQRDENDRPLLYESLRGLLLAVSEEFRTAETIELSRRLAALAEARVRDEGSEGDGAYSEGRASEEEPGSELGLGGGAPTQQGQEEEKAEDTREERG
jgi:hypothetical protein